MDFFLFLLVNATLFIRPAEFAPALLGLPIYECLIVACLVLAAPKVLEQLSPAGLAARPISACVLGLLPAIVLSHLTNFRAEDALNGGVEFLKVLLYYLLLVGLVDSTARLRRFLRALAVCAAGITLLSVLHYHGVIQLEAIRYEETGIWDASGGVVMLRRLGSTGVFQDPNDMCLMLVAVMIICLHEIIERGRWLWAAPLALFGHALTLTHSRGGFLAFLAGVSVVLLARFGRKAVALGVLVLPALFAVFAGRQTEISLSGGTGQSRILLWSEGLVLFTGRPFFGIGYGRYEEYVGQVAHNSFIHCFTELGFVGGALFLGMFALAFQGLHGLDREGLKASDPDLARLRPYVLGIVAGYSAGLMSLSCSYIIPTYTVVGLAAVVLRLAGESPWQTVPRLNARLVRRLGLIGACFVIVAHVYVRLFGRFG